MSRTITVLLLSAALFGLAGCSPNKTDEAGEAQSTLAGENETSSGPGTGIGGVEASRPNGASSVVGSRNDLTAASGQQGVAPPTAGPGAVKSESSPACCLSQHSGVFARELATFPVRESEIRRVSVRVSSGKP